MKTLLLLLTTITMTAQVTIHGSIQGIENMAFFTDLNIKGQINESDLVNKIEGHYFIVEHVSDYTKIVGDHVRVTLKGSPVIGINRSGVETLSEGNTTEWINPNQYDQIRIGRGEIVKEQIFDIRGRYLGNEIQPTFQESIYIVVSYYSDGSKTSKKIKI